MADVPSGRSGRPALQVAQAVALMAGAMLGERFHGLKRVSFKGRRDIVTDVDKEVEAAIFAELRQEFPDMALLGEESGGVRADSGYVWIVDPLDGTRNYASGIPFFSVVVGLALDGEPLVGVNYDPMRQEMFHAAMGRGAFLNDAPVHVSGKARVEDCILGTDLSYSDEGALNSMKVILAAWPGMQAARIMGSAALGLSYAAAGRTDLYFHHQLEPWDQVAGLLLVEEAGGIITDRNGGGRGCTATALSAPMQPCTPSSCERRRDRHGAGRRIALHRSGRAAK